MNQLFATYNVRDVAWDDRILCNHSIVHVHWFSGFV